MLDLVWSFQNNVCTCIYIRIYIIAAEMEDLHTVQLTAIFDIQSQCKAHCRTTSTDTALPPNLAPLPAPCSSLPLMRLGVPDTCAPPHLLKILYQPKKVFRKIKHLFFGILFVHDDMLFVGQALLDLSVGWTRVLKGTYQLYIILAFL